MPPLFFRSRSERRPSSPAATHYSGRRPTPLIPDDLLQAIFSLLPAKSIARGVAVSTNSSESALPSSSSAATTTNSLRRRRPPMCCCSSPTPPVTALNCINITPTYLSMSTSPGLFLQYTSTFASQLIPASSLRTPVRARDKEVHFNQDGSTIKKLEAGVSLVARLVGVTLGPKGRNVVLENKYGPPKIVNDGVTVLKEVELEDPLENIGAKLVRLAAAKTNDLAGDGTTTSVVLAHGLIVEGLKVIATGMNPRQIARGIEKTAKALVHELKLMSKEIEDHELADVAAISAGNDYVVGKMIADALKRVGKLGMVMIEKGRNTENTIEIMEGMQFDRGFLSPHFITDHDKFSAEFEDCKLLLVDKKIKHAEEVFKILDNAAKEQFPILILAEDIEKEALAPIIRNKLKGNLRVAAIKAPSFGERKSHCLDDIAILTGGTVIRDASGLILEKAGKEVLGSAKKVVVKKDSTLIISDGTTRKAVEKRVAQISKLVENTQENFQKKILKERIARLSGAIAIVQVGAPTEVELKDRKLRIEDALNATKAAIEEGVVIGGACSLLRLSNKVDDIAKEFENDEQKVGANIFKKALLYPAKLIAKNAGVNGNIVVEKVLSTDDARYGYNAAKNTYEDLIDAGIIDPAKVVRCCLEHAASVAKVFLTLDVVVAEIKEPELFPMRRTKPKLPSLPTSLRKPPIPSLAFPTRRPPMRRRKSGLGL